MCVFKRNCQKRENFKIYVQISEPNSNFRTNFKISGQRLACANLVSMHKVLSNWTVIIHNNFIVTTKFFRVQLFHHVLTNY